MTTDGIPETLPPVSETAERSHFASTEPRPAPQRRRTLPEPKEDEQLEGDGDEIHVLDDIL